jgi:hypothetical protein
MKNTFLLIKKEYLCLDVDGNEEVVTEIDNNQASIKLNFLKIIISPSCKYLFIYLSVLILLNLVIRR